MKNSTVFVCSECGHESAKWMGKCPSCGEWNTMNEETVSKSKPSRAAAQKGGAAPMSLDSIQPEDGERIKTSIKELDTVLGGGLMRGSLVLVGGEPGIGKSTLLLQICNALGKTGTVLYVSGEESEKQLKLRADRLGITTDALKILPQTDIDAALYHVDKLRPQVVIVDSVQTMFTEELTSASGSVAQVREVTMRLMRKAKEENIAFFIVGHVTKDGNIAGPRVLEHMVDCVLYFEGDRQQSYRILRAVKNRFGSTNEIGVFEMTDKGLSEVANPSSAMLSGRPESEPGSAVTCLMEGTRPILSEVQALVCPTGFGIARRAANGMDYNRMVLLIAVIEKKLGINMQNQDAYINVIGGIKIDETAADLAVICAIASSATDRVLRPQTLFLGEVGLSGELRAVSFAERRIAEAARMGFTACVLPKSNADTIKNVPEGIRLFPASSIRDVLSHIKQGDKK